MTLIKKLTAVVVAGALSLGCFTSAFAETYVTPVFDPGGPHETVLIDVDENQDSTESEDTIPDSGVDLSDTQYTPVDINGYTEWDGKTAMESGVNYYIDKPTNIIKNVSVPEGSTLVLRSGAELLIYKDISFSVRGNVIAELDSAITVSGTLTVFQGAGFETYGRLSTTVSSKVQVLSEFIIRNGAEAIISGVLNIYSDGVYLNYGQTTLTANSKTTITGDLQTPADGRLICKGYLGITINGRSTQAGYFSLTGEFVNSGVLILESTVKYYKSKSARFAVSKSSRVIDYRRGDADASISDGSDDMGQTTDVGAKGIDVSYAQGAVDWAAVKAAGIDFAMIRASRGAVGKNPIAKDTCFDYNITQASANGLKVGVYHYLYASTAAEAKKEAQFFLQTIAPYKITYPVVLDVEEQYQANLGKTKITSIVKTFLDEVSAAGYYAMIYANKTWLTDNLDMSKLSEYDVWLAQWNTVPTYTGDFGIWQYSSKGIVSGIDGYVDLDISYKDYSTIIKNGKYNNLS